VSIGMPVFNGEQFLAEAISSLLAQTHSDFELLLSDNASTDRTPEICSMFARKDSRIRYVRQQDNIGAAENFKFVLKNTSGPFFMWAAADDRWPADWIATLLGLVRSQPCFSFGRIRAVGADGAGLPSLANARDLTFAGSAIVRRVRFFLSPGQLGKANLIYGLFRRTDLDAQVLNEFCSGKWGADMLAIYRVLAKREARCAASVTMLKRDHPGAASSQSVAKHGPAESLAIRWLRAGSRVFVDPMLGEYMRLSSGSERFLLFVAYPLAAARNLAGKLQYRLRRREFLLANTERSTGVLPGR
jgi:glycosyltransferase involved in cell wall biosynthesis